METLKANGIGVFPVEFQIGGDKPGAPEFIVNFLVYTPGKTVSGPGQITWVVNPEVKVSTHLYGTYSYMTVMPKITHILVVATGYAAPGPVVPSNVELRMVLDENWQGGTANYKFYDGTKWVEIENAPVTIINSGK